MSFDRIHVKLSRAEYNVTLRVHHATWHENGGRSVRLYGTVQGSPTRLRLLEKATRRGLYFGSAETMLRWLRAWELVTRGAISVHT